MMMPLSVAYTVYDDPNKSFLQGETDGCYKISCDESVKGLLFGMDDQSEDLSVQVLRSRQRMGKLCFRRNCIEHIDPDHDDAAYCSMDIHRIIIEIIPELIPQVVNAAHIMITDNNFGEHVKLLFWDMGWKRLFTTLDLS
ncbi:hypothetical protein AAHA92_33460 [Salvia divinorum]|uniref:Uncharacterized protein n=1 Tax=Salvia divinorum TaxID=28513 RepID=A0ABD1FP16_SALDI